MATSILHSDLTTPEYWDRVHVASSHKTVRLQWLRQPEKRRLDAVFSLIIDQIGPHPGDILELGCAPGTMLRRMKRLRPQHRYHGLDYAEQGVEIARQQLKRADIDAKLYAGDLRTFDPPQEYDLVESFGLIEHFTDPLAILRAHVRFCRPGGYVAVTFPNFASPIVKWFIKRLDPQGLDAHCIEIMNLSVIEELMKEAGLTDVRVGSVGSAKLRWACRNPTFSRRIYRTVARCWNLFAILVPFDFLWHSMIWATGRVREDR